MPEGDSVALDALRLAPALLLRPVVASRSRRPLPSLVGRTAVRLHCRGKHLLVAFDDGTALHVHRRMTGAWTFHGSEPRSLDHVDVALDVGAYWVIARDMPVCELLPPGVAEQHPALAALGPDLIGLVVDGDGPRPLPTPDWSRIAALVAARPATPLHELLLDQRVACGIGNVYKSELLFLHRLHPWAAAGEVAPEHLDALYRDARDRLVANSVPGPRTTRGEGRTGATWVYGRAGRPCLRCGEPVASDPGRGERPRVTFWCPRCQRTTTPMG